MRSSIRNTVAWLLLLGVGATVLLLARRTRDDNPSDPPHHEEPGTGYGWDG